MPATLVESLVTLRRLRIDGDSPGTIWEVYVGTVYVGGFGVEYMARDLRNRLVAELGKGNQAATLN